MQPKKLRRNKKFSLFNNPRKIFLLLGFSVFLLFAKPAFATFVDIVAEQPGLDRLKSVVVVENAIAVNDLEQAWQNAVDSGGYSFRADIVQVAVPLAQPENIGRSSREYTFHVEGNTGGLTSSDLTDHSFEMFLWNNGQSVLDPAKAQQFKVENGVAMGRQGNQEWDVVDDMSSSFAPDGDFFSYLSASKNVANSGDESRQGISFTRYTFEIDGPQYATYMRDQLETRLTQKGELPPGVNLQLPEVYQNMSGTGELWVGDDGLPLRQKISAKFPPQGEEDFSTHVEITTDFFDFPETGDVAALPGLPSLASIASVLGEALSATLLPMATISTV
ncbi:MAG: hypothetical protein ACI85U_003379, partial [Candidatus Promineifilaceae bacterium]